MAEDADFAVEELRSILLPPDLLTAELTPLIANMLREQYDRSPDEVAQAIAPLVGEAISLELARGREDIVETLGPVISEVLNEQIQASPERLAQIITPVVDQALEAQASHIREDILETLPTAISEVLGEQIEASPERFAQAVAPVVDQAIQEQASQLREEISQSLPSTISEVLDQRMEASSERIAQTIVPMVDEAIQRQIAVMRQELLDALQPLVRETTEEAVSQTVGEPPWLTRILLGLPKQPRRPPIREGRVLETEQVGPEGPRFVAQDILLVHRETGEILYLGSDPAQPQSERALDPEMLAAIRDYERESLDVGESGGFAYGGRRILVATGEVAYLAVIGDGVESGQFHEDMREALATIHEKHSESLADWQGEDEELVATAESTLLPWLPRHRVGTAARPRPSPPRVRRTILLGLLLLVLIVALLGCGWWIWRVERALAESGALGPISVSLTPTASLVLTATTVPATIAQVGQAFTPSSTPTETETPTFPATSMPTVTSTWTPTATATPTPTKMPTHTPIPTPTQTPVHTPSPVPTPTPVMGVMLGNVYTRHVPSFDVDASGVVRLGAEVELLAQYGEWFKVRVTSSGGSRSSVEGWLPARWVDVSQPIPSELVTPDC